tara:strand:- start:262 stop:399 length:138 start_codon:yes stop_codon:yes gene_type:complete
MPNFIDVMDKLEEMDDRLNKMYTALAVIFDYVKCSHDEREIEKLR